MARGGKREGAGRKRVLRRKCVLHRTRESFDRTLPALVTFRMDKGVYNLRSQRSFNTLKRAISGGKDRFGTRVIHFSVLGNHIHLIAETPDKESLTRAMKGLEVRIAKKMNGMMGRRGRVIGDRYHANLLRSHRAARLAVRYVRENHRKHYTKSDWRTGTTIDSFSSWAKVIALPAPLTAYLRFAESG